MSNNIICTMPWLLNAVPALEKVRKGNFSLVQEEASSRTICKIHSLALILRVGNGHFQLSGAEYPICQFHFCDFRFCLSNLRSWLSSSWHEHHSLYYIPAPLTCYLEKDRRMERKRKERRKGRKLSLLLTL